MFKIVFAALIVLSGSGVRAEEFMLAMGGELSKPAWAIVLRKAVPEDAIQEVTVPYFLSFCLVPTFPKSTVAVSPEASALLEYRQRPPSNKLFDVSVADYALFSEMNGKRGYATWEVLCSGSEPTAVGRVKIIRNPTVVQLAFHSKSRRKEFVDLTNRLADWLRVSWEEEAGKVTMQSSNSDLARFWSQKLVPNSDKYKPKVIVDAERGLVYFSVQGGELAEDFDKRFNN